MAARPDNPDETFNWIRQHKNTFNKFKNVQFYKVNKKVDAAPTNQEISEWSSCNNLKYITHEEMDEMLYN